MNGMNSKVAGLLAGLAALYIGAQAAPAQAHISLDRAGTHKSRYGDGEQKEGSCGRKNGKRGKNIYTYEPGQTITVKVAEIIPHPSYYRVAFDNDGDDDFLDPRSIKPIEATRRCPFNSSDQCGKSDFYNNATVLPGLDNIYPHSAAQAKTLTIQVKLPDVECDNCTLQVIQVMQDTVHGAYNTSPQNPDNSLEDVYHECIDLVLKRKPGSPGANLDASTPRTPNSTDAGTINPDGGLYTTEDPNSEELASIHGDHDLSGDPQSSSEGGCSLGGVGSTQSAAWFLVGVGALIARARRRRA